MQTVLLKGTTVLGIVLIAGLTFVALTSVVRRTATSIPILTGRVSPESVEPYFERRYAEHPWMTLAHIIPGGIFMIVGPIQFVPLVRRRWPALHRAMGRLFLLSCFAIIITSTLFVLRLPVYGAFASSVGVTFGITMFTISAVSAYVAIRQRKIPLHREWMIRTYAWGLGIASFRVLIPILILSAGATFDEAWDTVVWLGFLINAVVAEWWINMTRRSRT